MKWNDLFNYSDGKLYWKTRRGPIKAGTQAGGISDTGYIGVIINGRYHLAHRIIWEMHNGQIPDGMQIDHINHIRWDNRIENLRLVTHKSNGRNQSKSVCNNSGVNGVCMDPQNGKWRVYIHIDNKQINLGSFSDKNEAIRVRKDADIKYKFHVNHGH